MPSLGHLGACSFGHEAKNVWRFLFAFLLDIGSLKDATKNHPTRRIDELSGTRP